MIEKCEKRVPIPNKPLNISGSQFAPWRSAKNHLLVETLNRRLVFSQVSCLQTKPIDVSKNWSEYITDSDNQGLVFCIEWILPEVVVQIPDQMYQALLLAT